MTMPVESDSPSMVRLLRVKPAIRMARNVAMIEQGMARAATKAGRSFRTAPKKIMVMTMQTPVTCKSSSGSPVRKAAPTVPMMRATAAISHHTRLPMKTATMRLARRPPSSRWSCTSWIERLMKRERSRTTSNWMSWGSPFWISASRALMRSTTATVLVPDCLRMTQRDRVAPVQAGERAGLLLAVHHGGDVADADGAALEVGHDELLEGLGLSMRPSVRRPSSWAAARDAPPGNLHVLAGEGVLDLLDAQAVAGEPVGVDEDLDLALLAPHDGDGAHVLAPSPAGA